ncbi:MAG: type IIA DNA topoisomerase subunit B [Actinomycetota bacterium]|nr:type IIA DNA topoisomerase subunit B [Actinomycetota bacterium]
MQVLEGLEAVRKRPGMYIGSTGERGLHHLVYEVVDNSVDEALAGHCDRIVVTLLADGGVRVEDNGRGIPVDKHPVEKVAAVTVVMTMLHAGGKFGGSGYKVSGGLHGVGVSVVNALSAKLVVEVDRGGRRHRMAFADGGSHVTEKLSVIGDSPRGRTGTTVTFWPDESVFESTEFHARTILERIQMMAFLNKGLEIRFVDQRPGFDNEPVTYRYAGGIVDFVKHVNKTKEPLFPKVGSIEQVEPGQEVEIAFTWNTGYQTDGVHSFANGINTIEGGTHVEGFRAALTTVVNKYARAKNLLKEKDDNLAGEDIREGIVAIISVRLREPQFEGQTKSKLGNPEIKTMVQRATNERLGDWFEENPTEGNKVVKKAIAASQARLAAKKARDVIRNKTLLDGAGMPDKLKDCSSKNREERELFIVEGDSAGGSASNARDPRTQAILPIRGKILNVERARLDRMLKNLEVQALIGAIGAGVGEEFDSEKRRYDKIVLLADADVDGGHIRTLLLTFFFRQMKTLVELGCVYIAQPPLYSTEVRGRKIYLKDDRAKDDFMEANPNHKKDFARLKGLGEMDAEELHVTTMDAGLRTLLQVTVEQAALADEVMSILMGEDVESRKQFIVTNAKDVRFLDV